MLRGFLFIYRQGNSIAVPDPLPEYDNDADETNNEVSWVGTSSFSIIFFSFL